MSQTKTRVFVTGMGAVTPYGNSVATLWQSLLDQKSAISTFDRFDLGGTACTKGGLIRNHSPALPADFKEPLDLATGFALDAAREALEQAGGILTNTGLIASSNFGSLDLAECALTDESGAAALSALKQDYTNQQLMRLLGLDGVRATLSLSCAASAATLAYAAGLLRYGRAERLLVVGYDALSRCAWSGLCSLRTMTNDAVRPFDLNRSGTIFSEGACALMLETEDSCIKSGATPLAELSGWATGNNGHHMTAPAPRGRGSADVMRRAIAMAQLTPEEVDHINAHGTATKPNDISEAQALTDIFGENIASIPVTSNKGAAGHLLGAAGGIEAISSILSLRTGMIPPIANFETADPDIRLNLVTGAPLKARLKTALSNSAGFGGCNSALLFNSI